MKSMIEEITQNNERLTAAFVYNSSAFLIVSISKLNPEEGNGLSDLADMDWLNTFCEGRPLTDFADPLTIHAMVKNTVLTALQTTSRNNMGSPLKAIDLVLEWAKEEGLSDMMLIKQPLH